MTRSGDNSRLRVELAEARRELQRWRAENQQLRAQQAADSATITHLRAQLQRVEDAYRQQSQVLTATRQQLAQAQEQLTRLGAHLTQLQHQLAAADLPAPGPAHPPAWVKPNKPTTAKQPRRKRARVHNHGRPADPPTRVECHQFTTCPHCQATLAGQRLRRRRIVIEVPPPPPLDITEHQIYAGWCPACQRWWVPRPDLSAVVLGQGQIGLRLASLIATLRYQGRLPLDVLAALLASLWDLKLSVGGLVRTLARLRQTTEPAFRALQAQARASAVLHMDETGWRENGGNGYVWELATGGAMPVVVYAHDRSRAGAVMARLLDGQFSGVLVCDFYCGYNGYPGRIQRCWVHLLRDLHDLAQEHPAVASVRQWTGRVKQL
jgi:transposase